jgi:hypothetical protein
LGLKSDKKMEPYLMPDGDGIDLLMNTKLSPDLGVIPFQGTHQLGSQQVLAPPQNQKAPSHSLLPHCFS